MNICFTLNFLSLFHGIYIILIFSFLKFLKNMTKPYLLKTLILQVLVIVFSIILDVISACVVN